LKELLNNIKTCTVCEEHLPLGPNPVMAASVHSKILIIGQAPGTKVHETGIPWNDPSGKQLRKWMAIEEDDFYNSEKVGIVPMGFCYPGKGKSGDLPPRPECAPLWHDQLLSQMKEVELTILIGQYAQREYLGDTMKTNLTETVRNYKAYLPEYLPLHPPSPRNRFWLGKNPWFIDEVVPLLQDRVKRVLS